MSNEISRRKLIKVAATTAMGSTVLAGCVAAGVSTAPPPPPGPPPPPPGPPPPPEGAPPEGTYSGGAGSAAPAMKQTKAEARYQDHPNGRQHCGMCANFIPPNDCRVIQGPVSADGWCRNFRAKAAY